MSLGDLLLDVIVRLEQPLAEGADANAVTRLGAGGQAANVAAWIAALGGRARFVGKRADDEAGAIAAAELERHGVELRGPVVSGRTGTVVSLVAEDGSRTMASDRGVSPELRADELDPAWLEGCEHLHLPGYSLLRSPVDEAALAAARLAPRVSVDLSSWSAIRDFGPERFRERLEELRPDVIFANEDEERILGGPIAGPSVDPEARPARRELRRRRAARPCRRRCSTRPEPATPSRPATSSAARSSRSQRLRAAWRS